MRYQTSSFDHLKARLAELNDDPSKHWSEYPCLEWDRARSAGYGSICVVGHSSHVHRVAYQLVHGDVARHISICHHCDNPACFRPSHLFAGTQQDNMRDCAAKGRIEIGDRRGNKHWVHKLIARREPLPCAKLTPTQVAEIRSSTEGATALAARFDVNRSVIWKIRTRRTWADY